MSGASTKSQSDAQSTAVLYQIARALLENAPRESGELLALVLDQTIAALGAERGMVVVNQDGTFRATIARNFRNQTLDETEGEVSSSIARRVLEERRAVLLGNATDSEFSANPSVQRLALRSVLCAALLSGKDAFALLYLENRSIENCFTEAHRALLDEICAMAAPRIEAAVALQQARDAARQLGPLLATGELITADPGMAAAMALAQRVAPTELPVLIQGETGTGKELVARSLYRHSRRQHASFVIINCAAIPATLMESELFGHVRGAFTGATHDRIGLIGAANRGTVFLDEIGELPLDLQPKLLRVLQSGEVTRLGATKSETFDVRFISATNRDLEREVDEGRFRSDLYYRIAGAVVALPPLRQRPHDIRLLADHFLKLYAERYGHKRLQWSAAALQALAAYAFPGNVRELESECARLVAMADFGGATEVAPQHLSQRITSPGDKPAAAAAGAASASAPIAPMSLAEMEKRLIVSVLEHTENNRTRAAEVLGISREGLRIKMQRLGL
ncbi:MAG: sigma-54-dependent Fis family transcriptional regulator [Terriglobales bacterium]